MQKDFINNLTHEFKTPIAAVMISSDVLLQNETISQNPRLKQYAQIIKNQNQLLNTQVERVLQVAQMEKTDFQINPEPVDTHQIITDLVSSMEPRIKARHGEITMDLKALAPVVKQIQFILSTSLRISWTMLLNILQMGMLKLKFPLTTKPIKWSLNVWIMAREYPKNI